MRQVGVLVRALGIAALSVVVTVGAISACGNRLASSKAPHAICGHVLGNARVDTNLVDASKPGTITVTKLNWPGRVLVRLSDDCAHGADIDLVPESGMALGDEVHSADGHLADLVVTPFGRDVELVATRRGGQPTYLKFHLVNLQPCNGGTPC